MKSDKKIKIQLIHSASGRPRRQKETVRGLGFTKLYQVREIQDTPALRGMANKIPHLVKILD